MIKTMQNENRRFELVDGRIAFSAGKAVFCKSREKMWNPVGTTPG